MFAYPAQAQVDRKVPKSVIYKNAKPSNAVKELFVHQVSDIIWKYKLAQDTINLPPKGGYAEIQVFDILLKALKIDSKVLATIDKAIPYPLFFRMRFQERVNHISAFKRPNQAGDRRWVLGTYFETGWRVDAEQKTKLPLALDLRSLYEHMLMPYIGLPRRDGETLEALIERQQLIKTYLRKLKTFRATMKKERQFSRKVELNTRIRTLEKELEALKQV